MTTNCLIEPSKSYVDRIYTRSVVGWHGVKHIKSWDQDFQQVIDQALAMPGFAEDAPKEATQTVRVGKEGEGCDNGRTGDLLLDQLYLGRS